jgi:hypothetical protein
VNAATGEVIGVSEQPADELPDTFTGGTELTIGSRTWNVVGAEPASSAERTRTGALRLTLREPQVVDPQRVRYSMSSICDELPPVADEEADGDATLTLHEDLWRDIELISARHQAAIDANIAAIDRIERDAAGAAGYGDLHLRVEPSSPLAGVELWLDELLSQLSGTRMPDGVAFRARAADRAASLRLGTARPHSRPGGGYGGQYVAGIRRWCRRRGHHRVDAPPPTRSGGLARSAVLLSATEMMTLCGTNAVAMRARTAERVNTAH